MKTFISLFLMAATASQLQAQTAINGEAQVDAATMTAFVRRHNPDFNPEIASAFIEVGARYGIRGDIALCQAILETGWFRYEGGTKVTPDMHNYCGLGVTSLGVKGCSFSSVEEGVSAMFQHLYAYCCTDPLPEGENEIDPRFRLVSRGCATTWESLSGRWAMNPVYGDNILKLYAQLSATAPAAPAAPLDSSLTAALPDDEEEAPLPDEFF